jgi:hypothetical protein
VKLLDFSLAKLIDVDGAGDDQPRREALRCAAPRDATSGRAADLGGAAVDRAAVPAASRSRQRLRRRARSG